jgi:hypothetical protein
MTQKGRAISRTRVLHLPGHTPYARKLRGARFEPVNGMSDRVAVPFGASVPWLLDQPTWDFFDVAHLHSVELVGYEELERLTERLGRVGKPLIYTAHEVLPNIEQDRQEFSRKTGLILSAAQGAVTLTPWAQRQLCEQQKLPSSQVEVLPHGYAVQPGHRTGPYEVRHRELTLGVYGALRPNRCVEVALDVWRHVFDKGSFKGALRLLLRSINAADVGRYSATLAKAVGLLGDGVPSDIRLMSSTASDAEIISFCQASSTILLPYSWASHSGQLELAHDLGLPMIAPELGGLLGQVAFHQGPAPPLLWFDPTLLAGEEGHRSLAGMVRAFLLTRPEPVADPVARTEYRLDEQVSIIKRYDVLYHRHKD